MNEQVQTKGSAPTDGVNRRRLLYAGVAAAAGLCGAGLGWWKYSRPGAGAGVDPSLWQRKFDMPTGETLDLQSFRGKLLVLNFWATWCPPCVEEMPLLDRFYRKNSSKGWKVVGLAIDKRDSVRRFLRDFPVSFPVGLAESGGTELVRSLGNLSGGLPFSLIVGREGQVIQRKIGRLTPADLGTWAAFEAVG